MSYSRSGRLAPLHRGANNVARAIALSGAKFRPKEGMVSRFVLVNGPPGIVSYHGERLLSVFAVDAREEHISATNLRDPLSSALDPTARRDKNGKYVVRYLFN